MNALERAVSSLARFLDERRVPYMIIGGVANLVWGEPRATLDVDASVLVEDAAWPGLFAELRRSFRLIPRDPQGFLQETHVLPLETRDGVRLDLIWAQLPYEYKAIARAVVEEVGGVRVRVCRPEDLIVHKILADRPKDREDVRAVVRQQAGRLDRRYVTDAVRDLSAALDRPDLLQFLEDCLTAGRRRT